MDKLQNAIISSVLGAVFGLLSSLIHSRFRLWGFSRNIKLKCNPKIGSSVTVQVINDYIFPINQAVAYISVTHQLSDILEPPNNREAFIHSGHQKVIENEKLCWSVNRNPASLDIYAGESQNLDVFEVDPSGMWIQIPSEVGWSTRDKGPSRAFLKPQKYNATLKIVSKDTKAKSFKIEIDPLNGSAPLRLVG